MNVTGRARWLGAPGRGPSTRTWVVVGVVLASLTLVVALFASTSSSSSSPDEPAALWFPSDGSGIAYVVRVRDGQPTWACVRETGRLVCAGPDRAVDIQSGSTSKSSVVGNLDVGVDLVVRHDRGWSCSSTSGALVGYVCERNT